MQVVRERAPPESPGLHNDVDVQLVNPNNVVVASSGSAGSIFEFEKVRGPTGLVSGTWKIRIHAFSVTSNQPVYWAFAQQM